MDKTDTAYEDTQGKKYPAFGGRSATMIKEFSANKPRSPKEHICTDCGEKFYTKTSGVKKRCVNCR